MSQRAEEWNKRISIWIDELQNHLYEELGTVDLEGYVTKDRLTYEEAIEKTYVSMVVGTEWGAKWEYGWFRADIVLPEAARGKCIFFIPKTGGESLAWVDGAITCAIDLQHHEVKLTDSGIPGKRYTVVLESYAGHGPRLENGGPNPPERVAIPEPSARQVAVGTSSFGILNQEAFSLSMDVITLYKLWQALDPKSLRYMKIKEGLQKFTKLVDYELPQKERNATFVKARQVLQPLLSCVNGSTMPSFTIFGQSHLDLAWKWPWEETRRKCGRTYATQLMLADEYPEYKFLACEPVILETLRKEYPELYTRLKEKVKLGQFLPEGGVWVEPDTNIPSGESLIRQCIWGIRWFWKEFGYKTRMVWLPDCFGFSGQLPQIMAGTGIKYFATQKMARALKGHDRFPYNIFWWEGIDGTRILTHFYNKNNSRYDPQLLIERWNHDRVQKDNIDTFLFPFGFGDGGGGPTREMLEVATRTKDLEGVPRTIMESPISFFEEIEGRENVSNIYVGELYLAWHRGTYTAQAKTKKGNRKAEIALRDLEFWGTLAQLYREAAKDGIVNTEECDRNECYPRQELHELWGKLLFNQFHDILAGTSITRVHREAERDFETIIRKANRLKNQALGLITSYANILCHGTNHGINYDINHGTNHGINLGSNHEINHGINHESNHEINHVSSHGIHHNTEQEAAYNGSCHASEAGVEFIMVFNSLSWDRTALVSLPERMTGAANSRKEALPSQRVGDEYFVRVEVPACGYTTIYPFQSDELLDKSNTADLQGKISLTDNGMENAFLRIRFNEYGEIISIYDKEADIEYASGCCNRFRMYQDINVDYDAWELSNFYQELPVELEQKVRIETIATGELFATLRIHRKLNNSDFVQDITIYVDSRRIDFKTTIDWQETHKLLKVEFPVAIVADDALEEIQFGYVKRPTHSNRQYDADRFEVCNHRYTALTEETRCFAVLNDSKYGVNTDANRICLSLLRAPLIPDMYADKGIQEFTYSIYCAPCSFYESEIIRQGYELNISVACLRGKNAPLNLSHHSRITRKPDEMSFIAVSNPGIILETVKMAEDGSENIILRLYESRKCHLSCELSLYFTFDHIVEVNMLEELESQVKLTKCDKDGAHMVRLTFRPFEIKTLRIVRR